MKRILFLLIPALVFFSSCTGENDVKFEAFNPEVFSFDIGDEYEINASVRVKGFEIKGEGTEFNSSIGYELDLVKPGGETEKAFISKIEDFNFSEKVSDTGIDIQFNLDTTFSKGQYKLIFNLKDVFSGKTANTSADFTLE